MKPLAIVAAVALFAETLVGQVMGPAPSNRFDSWTQRKTTISSMVAYGSYSVGGEDRFGPMFVFQYMPNRFSMPAFDIFAGVLMQKGQSGPVGQGNYVPVQSYLAPYYSPFSNYRNDNAFRYPAFTLGLVFLGADFTVYFLDGDVRPYVGLGGSLNFWSYSSQLSGALSPDAKAGLDIHLNNSLSGFVEARRFLGVPNLVGPNTPRFDGLTSIAFGISFAPRLR